MHDPVESTTAIAVTSRRPYRSSPTTLTVQICEAKIKHWKHVLQFTDAFGM